MNNSNDDVKSEAQRIAIEELLNSSDSDRVAIEELLSSSDSDRVAIKELIKQSSFVAASFSNVRIIQPKPSSTIVKPSNYREAVLLNIEKPIR